MNNQYNTATPLNAGAVPYQTTVTPTGTTFNTGEHAAPSALKGNITAMMGKIQHDPVKEHHGNAMVASSKEAKAARFEAKALEWERKGNMNKAQKNRGKAATYRQRAIAKLNQPTTAVPMVNRHDKAARCEAKALEYEKKGNLAKAQRNRERAYRIRQRHNIPHPVGTVPPMTTTTTTTVLPAH